jgi:hypothetical protein
LKQLDCLFDVRISRIVARILRDMYGLRPPPIERRFILAARYTQELNDWRHKLAYLLNSEGIESSLLLPIFLRQRNVLNLACWHAQLLLHRPFILQSFASLTNYSKTSRLSRHPDFASNVQLCLDAALNIVKVVDYLHSTGQFYSSFWVSGTVFFLYFFFVFLLYPVY